MKLLNLFKCLPLLVSCLTLAPSHAWANGQLIFKDYNIILVTTDCLRPDRMGLYGYERDTTPNMNKFFKGAARFDLAIGQSAWTTPSILSILTSLYPAAHGIDAQGKNFNKNFFPPLEQLNEEGYNNLGYLIINNFGNQGWTEEIKLGRFLETLENYKDKKFFAWYHYRETHLPYTPPEKFKKAFYKGPPPFSDKKLKVVATTSKILRGFVEFDDKQKAHIRDLYDAEVLYMDSNLHLLFEHLKSIGIEEKTIVVLTSDHGDELFEHGFIGHASTTLEATLFDELIRVPLLIKVPGVTFEKPIKELVQHVHIMPTLFELLGIKPKFLTQGKSMVPLMFNKNRQDLGPAFVETTYCGWQCPDKESLKERVFAVRDKEWKLIEERKKTGVKYSLYNLRNDPGERKNLFESEKEIAEEYKKLLSENQLENLHAASNLATRASKKHINDAEKLIDQKAFDKAVEELEDVLHFDKVYSLENPSFIDDPGQKAGWRKIIGRAYELLGLAYTEKAKEYRIPGKQE